MTTRTPPADVRDAAEAAIDEATTAFFLAYCGFDRPDRLRNWRAFGEAMAKRGAQTIARLDCVEAYAEKQRRRARTQRRCNHHPATPGVEMPTRTAPRAPSVAR